MTVRTRFAPSPTGYLHIGGVRTALFNWLFARRHGGQFLLRIDDTDAERNVAEALRPILEGFRWLGLDWDEGPEIGGPYAPYYQSQRGDRYRAEVERLVAGGAAYRDYATTEEIQAERETAQREQRRFLYSRRWMAETDAQATAFEAEGRRAIVRLRMPREGRCDFHDLVRGDVAFEWALEQDHVVQRADGTCLYHLASTVDDHDFAITHVIRAVEHLSNTPRQIFIATALGYTPPAYAHLPYVAAPGSAAKLSKRKLSTYLRHHEFKKSYDHGAGIAEAQGLSITPESFNPVVVDFYREVGYEPDALLNYLLLLGWSLDDRTETFTREEMIEHFSLERINRSAASFDPQKLLAFQERRMQALSVDARVARVVPFLERGGLVGAPSPDDQQTRIRQVVEAAHTEAEGVYNGVGLVKLMGRYSGSIAAAATLASGDVNFCLVPEVPFTLTGPGGLLDLLERRLADRHHALIVAAEGAGQELFNKAGDPGLDASGNTKLLDIGLLLKETISAHCHGRGVRVDIKYIDPSYTIRGLPANSMDSGFCLVLGQHAVHAGMAGRTDLMIGSWNHAFTHVPLSLVTQGRKHLEPEEETWQRVLDATGQPRQMVGC
ncbi:MAG: glutamate--tRNA ligase [Acidobacteria bacterium]|nr:glutamate--tRNA ligase [Acidobacteriota bacterium]